MIEKLKELGVAAKGLLLYIIAPILAVLGYIYYLHGKINGLKEEVAESKAEKELAITLSKKEEMNNEANKAESDYNTIRDNYLKQLRNGGPKSDT